MKTLIFLPLFIFASIPATYAQVMTNSLTSYGLDAGTQAPESVYFGHRAGRADTSGFSTFIGHLSGYRNTSGSSNTFIGNFAGGANKIGNSNTLIGSYAGGNSMGGSKNTYLGNSTGWNLEGGNNNICIGDNSGPFTANTIVSNRLFIDVVRNDNPLIYGEFDNDLVRINGSFEAMGAISQSSSRDVKCNVVPINANDILSSLMTIPIQKWSYINAPLESHIGPMAQDFYKAFGLGNGAEAIATVDSDGIALAAIQILKLENDELRKLIQSMNSRILELESKIE